MAYVPNTGNGSALAAQMRSKFMTGTGVVPWMVANNIPTSQFYVGEIGIPASSNPLVDENYHHGFTLALQQLFLDLNAHNMHFAGWVSGEWNIDIKYYRNVDGSNKPLSHVTTSGVVLEQNLTGMNGVTAQRGVNVWGMEASDTGGGSGGLNIGTLGAQYYVPQKDDFVALASRGITLVRLPIRWERIQPRLGGALDPTYLGYIQDILTWCAELGLKLNLDLHNYAAYDTIGTGQTTNGVFRLGQNAPATHKGIAVGFATMNLAFADLWSKIATALNPYSAMWAYGLVNEPVNCPNGRNDWFDASRKAVEAIRLTTQTKYIAVGGYFYSGIGVWSDNNGPTAWLTDVIPSGQVGAGQLRNTDPLILWEGHQYFDYDGTYTGDGGSFPTLNNQAIGQGFAAYNNNQPPAALPITAQTGERLVFNAVMSDVGEWTLPAGGNESSFAGTNTVSFIVQDSKNYMRVATTNTSDEGGVRKTLIGENTARKIAFPFQVPSAASVSLTDTFTIMHIWDQNYYTGNGSANLVEIRIIGSGAGYKVCLTDPNGAYLTNTGTTVLAKGVDNLLTLETTDTSFKLYIGESVTPDVTLNKSLSGISIGGIALGKFYGTSYNGDLLYGGIFKASKPGALYDAAPNGGLMTYSSSATTTTTSTTTAAPTTTTTTTSGSSTTTTTTTVEPGPTTTTTTTPAPTTTTTTTAPGYSTNSTIPAKRYSQVATSGSYNDLTNKPTIPPATSLTTTGTGTATYNTSTGALNIPTPPSQVFSSLTTTGTSGAATLASGVLNIPQYLGGGATNLTTAAAPSTVTINSDTGTDAIIAAADATNSGVFLPAEKTKLSGIATGATANDTDANLRARSSHTGTQLASTISDFGSAASAAAPVQSVASKTGAVTLVKGDVGLGSVDNTSDATKPVSTAQQTALDAKQATLVSGTNIKTVNGTTLLGGGDIVISGGGGTTNYYALNKDAQSFTPASSASSQAFTLSGTELVKGVYLNGQRLLTSEYSLAGSTLTVTPAAGLTTTDNVLVDQVSNSTAAAGSAVQISDYTDYTSIADPAVPASGKLRVYAKTISGRIVPKVITPGGRDYPLQPSFFQNAITMVSPNATTTLGTVGAGVTTVGTISHPAKTETYGFMANFVTAGTAAATAGTGSRDVQFHRGSTTGGANGFFVYERLAFPDASYNQTGAATGSKLFVGVTSVALSALAPLDTSASSHIFGFSRRHTDTGAQDTNWQLWTGNGTTNTFVDTGMVFAPAKVFDFYVYCQPHPNNTTMYWRIDNITDGTTFEGSTSTTLPGTTTALRAGFQIYSVDAVARNVRMSRIYTETDR